MNHNSNSKRLSMGVSGLDEVLHGGLLPGQAVLLRGCPGSGKTTLGLHFLAAGVAAGEKTLYITLEEPENQIRANAAKMGFDLSSLEFLDLSPNAEFFAKAETYDIFSPAEVEREPTTEKIAQIIQKIKPARIFLDPMTQFRYLTSDLFQYRRQVLPFIRFVKDMGATLLFTSERSQEAPDEDLQFLSDGIIEMVSNVTERSVSILKYRGSNFRKGSHSLRLDEKGITVFPRLLAEISNKEFHIDIISSGIPSLDELLHGGLERGTVTLITGPSGTGKTTLGLQFMKEAAGRGERSIAYIFEEGKNILIKRCESINLPLNAMVEHETLSIVQIEPLLYSANEFAAMVKEEVEKKAKIFMIDSTTGYQLCLREGDLAHSLHALRRYLKNHSVTVILVNEVESITGDFRATESGISFLADNIVFLRYLEIQGEMRKAIGVLKKRLSNFEKTLREFEITRYGINIGKPLTELRNILSGVPEWVQPEKG